MSEIVSRGERLLNRTPSGGRLSYQLRSNQSCDLALQRILFRPSLRALSLISVTLSNIIPKILPFRRHGAMLLWIQMHCLSSLHHMSYWHAILHDRQQAGEPGGWPRGMGGREGSGGPAARMLVDNARG